ncbi:MAG: hypothetical protein AAFR87_15375 [Bacteroidota bacterium]
MPHTTYYYLLALSFLLSCSAPQKETSTNSKEIDSARLSTSTQTELAEPPQKIEEKLPESAKVFIGSLNHAYPITLYLVQSGNSYTGKYYYDKFNENIRLAGKLEGEKILLKEFDASDTQTGSWSLNSKSLEEFMYGQWEDRRNKNQFSVGLSEIDPRAWKNTVKSLWAGSWTNGIGSLSIRMLDDHLFYFSHFSTNGRNIGDLSGTIVIEGNTATFKESFYDDAKEADDFCHITYTLIGDTLSIKQMSRNDCGAGNGVYFEGDYVKEEEYKTYFANLPLSEKIGENRLWVHFGNNLQIFLKLNENGEFSWTRESSEGTTGESGYWESQGTDDLLLKFDTKTNAKTYKVSELSTFSMRLRHQDEVLDFEMRGYY